MGDQFSEWDWFSRAYEKTSDADKAMRLYKKWRKKAEARQMKRFITARKRGLLWDTRGR